MATFMTTTRFEKDYALLDPSDKDRFKRTVKEQFVPDLIDLPRGGRFRPGLRVKGIQGASGILEMTWAPDGRATFEFGPPERGNEPHIIWRRVGTHDVFRSP
ncbi:hypothetical protein OIE13_05725 [Streptosporangium sp. NBC_01810]|uniref:hypothetical protein n=1 Tax=Streptosporangium sp. NBC_01810 TaxID=2975951 RepID=UPI002DDA2CC4|nr:hypothetical protein [Streptosporangium sp. NBC_01810]WSA27371.1 hypothetical protein OIE13_05725 [Streptosporangium sp. NBC_01810]